jgi:hypothetical protein
MQLHITITGREESVSRFLAVLSAMRSAGDTAFDVEVPDGKTIPLHVAARGGERRLPAEGAYFGEARFRREGRYWTIACRGDELRVRDMHGLGYIAELLRRPQRKLHLTELLAAAEGSEPSIAGMRDAALADAGDVLDAKAKAAYRRRLQELREELRDAKAAGACEHASQLEAEIDQLARELARALGLGGRDRRAVSGTERARFRVTKAIRAAIKAIDEASSSLGHHLATTIKTGTFCCYLPDPSNSPSWRF